MQTALRGNSSHPMTSKINQEKKASWEIQFLSNDNGERWDNSFSFRHRTDGSLKLYRMNPASGILSLGADCQLGQTCAVA